MRTSLLALLIILRSLIRSRIDLQLENLALRHQIGVLQRSLKKRPKLTSMDGSIRRECLDQVIVFNEGSLRRILASYFDYCHRSRTHLSLGKDSPETRPLQPPEIGPVVAVRQAGGLHHRYERRAA
jgi:hypothetical protein